MDVIEFFKTRYRLCKVGGCNECPLDEKLPDEEAITYCVVLDNIVSLDEFSQEQYEKAIEIVEKWGEENPNKTKTIADDYFEKNVLSHKTKGGVPTCCAKYTGYVDGCPRHDNEDISCDICWNLPYEESNYAKIDTKEN